MLSATSRREFAGSRLRSTIFLERKLRAHLVERDRLVFDSAFSPPARTATPFVHLYVTLRGAFDVRDRVPLNGPCAFVLAETEFDRVIPGAITFRSYGAPCTIVEMRVPARDVLRPIGLAAGALELPPAVWAAYEALAADPTEAALFRVVNALGEAGIVSRDLAGSVVEVEPDRFQRLWKVMRPFYENLSTGVSLKQIAMLAQLSLRQLGRDLGDLSRTFQMFGAGFRDAMRVLRLRAAVLLLSAPAATPAEVAHAVGYGSLDAMGRAFRDASLPAPSIVLDAVRYRW